MCCTGPASTRASRTCTRSIRITSRLWMGLWEWMEMDRFRGGGRNEWEEKRIASIDVETAAMSFLTENNMAAVCPAWAPGGNAIAYSAAPCPTAGSGIGGGEEATHLLAKPS